MKNYVPSLEKDFKPMIIELRKFKEKGTVPFAICVERQSGYKYRYDLNVMPGKDAENEEMIETVEEICEIIDECNSLLFGFVEMSHEIQNVVRSIANDVDEITEATGEVSEAFGELVHNTSQMLENSK